MIEVWLCPQCLGWTLDVQELLRILHTSLL
jgi:Zn-finger nucleic acid-binding protein